MRCLALSALLFFASSTVPTMAQETGTQRRPILKTGIELATNCGFEEGSEGHPLGWGLNQRAGGMQVGWGPYGIGGSMGIFFSRPDTISEAPGPASVSRRITRFEPGETIEVTAWLRLTGFKGSCVVWARCDTDTGYVRRQRAFENAYGAGYRLEGDTFWSPVTVRVTPDDSTAYFVMGVLVDGTGTVQVDEFHAVVPQAPFTVPRNGPGLYLAEGCYLITAVDDTPSLRIHIPVPILWRDQVPLSFRAWTEPDGHIGSIKIFRREHGFHVAEIVLENLDMEERIGFQWEAHVLAGPHTRQPIPEGIELPLENIPTEMAVWLEPTWCCDTEHPDIREVAEQIRGAGTTADVLIPETLRRMLSIFRAAEGRVTRLTAVQALTKQGSCTSCANLGAALLRANGIPARILAGYPTWTGSPLQTHYVVEYWLPGSGWRLMETTRCLDDRPGYEQIEVAMVLPPDESEEKAGQRVGGAGGVPHLSLTEYPEISDWSSATVRIRGAMPGATNSDHRAINLAIFEESPEVWIEAFDYLSDRWRRLMDEALSSPVAIAQLVPVEGLSSVGTLEELIQVLR